VENVGALFGVGVCVCVSAGTVDARVENVFGEFGETAFGGVRRPGAPLDAALRGVSSPRRVRPGECASSAYSMAMSTASKAAASAATAAASATRARDSAAAVAVKAASSRSASARASRASAAALGALFRGSKYSGSFALDAPLRGVDSPGFFGLSTSGENANSRLAAARDSSGDAETESAGGDKSSRALESLRGDAGGVDRSDPGRDGPTSTPTSRAARRPRRLP
jgi:hypothetical protein